jgi:tetratricopeptide (TPR) repeat protein
MRFAANSVSASSLDIRLSHQKEQLLALLDEWALVAHFLGKTRLRKRLLEVSRLADPDPWRDQVRLPKMWQDRVALVKLVAAAPPKSEIPPQMIFVVGTLLWKNQADAERWLRAGQAQYPADFWLNLGLGYVLQRANQRTEAVGFYRAGLAVRPQAGGAFYFNLALLLGDQNDLIGAVAAFQKAVEAGYQKNAYLYHWWAVALHGQGDLEGAVAKLKLAIQLEPKYAAAWFNLGRALQDQQKLPEALAAYHKAIALDPKGAGAWNNLGVVFQDQNRLLEAIAAYLRAIDLDPKFANAHSNLGSALHYQGRLDEAESAYRRAIQVKPDYAEAHCNLGQILQEQGRFAEALASRRRGHELGSKQPGWRYPSAQWVQIAERMLVLDKKLPAIVSGEEAPANLGEAVVLASMCQLPYQKRYAASARLYVNAFAAEPRLAADWNQQHRYNAACSAALAAAGQGEDARLLPDKAVAMFRRWALGWLRDDLTAYAKLVEQKNPATNREIRQRLAHWRRDPDLISVRDSQALDRLPDNEHAAWQALWQDMDKLLSRVAKKDEPTKERKDSEALRTKSVGSSLPPSGATKRYIISAARSRWHLS